MDINIRIKVQEDKNITKMTSVPVRAAPSAPAAPVVSPTAASPVSSALVAAPATSARLRRVSAAAGVLSAAVHAAAVHRGVVATPSSSPSTAAATTLSH